jgi:hypothetical protein
VVLIQLHSSKNSWEAEEMMAMTAKQKLKKPREELKKKPGNRKRKRSYRMTRRERWKKRKNKKPCLRNSKKRKRIERDKKQKLQDKDSLRSKRSRLKVLKRLLIKPLLSLRITKEKKRTNKRRSNSSMKLLK